MFCICFRLKDSSGWQHAFTSPHIESCIERIAINAKMGQGGGGEASSKMVAISYGSQVRLWGVSEDGTRTNIGTSIFSIVLITCANDLFVSNFRFRVTPKIKGSSHKKKF